MESDKVVLFPIVALACDFFYNGKDMLLSQRVTVEKSSGELVSLTVHRSKGVVGGKELKSALPKCEFVLKSLRG